MCARVEVGEVMLRQFNTAKPSEAIKTLSYFLPFFVHFLLKSYTAQEKEEEVRAI